MPAGDVYRLSVVGSVLGQQHVHTLHFIGLTAGADAPALAASWGGNMQSRYRAIFSTADTPVQSRNVSHVCGVGMLAAPIESVPIVADRPGTRVTNTEPMPPWLATVTSLRTAFAGRSRRGRFFLGGVYEQDQSGGNLNASVSTPLTDYANHLLATYGPAGTSADFRLTIFSRKLFGSGAFTCDGAAENVTGVIVRPVLGSMKSRRPGNGL